MAFNVTLYSNYYKPSNSTRLPDGGTDYPCNTVEPCAVVNPRISFNQGYAWNPSAFNYAHIADWGRYYWITDWTFDSGRWYASMKSDTLTSFREAILSREEYVVRSESEWDGNIIDQFYPAKTSFSISSSEFKPFSMNTLATGTFVLGVANGGSRGGVSYYCGSQDEMSSLFDFMYDNTDWLNGLDIDDISNDLLKCLVEPAQFLSSLMWFPLSKSQIASSYGGFVHAGWWQTNINLNFITGMAELSGSLVRGEHPQAERGNYLNYPPYTEASVYVPGFGNIQLNLNKFPMGKRIKLTIQIDTVTGQGTLFLYPEGSSIGSGQQLTAQIGVPIQLTSFTSDILGAITSVGSAIGTATNIASAIFGTIGAVGDAAKLLSPDVSTVGSNGNMSVFANNASATITYKLLVDEDIHHNGRPLFKRKTLSTLSGFTQIKDFDTNLPCTITEQNEIKAMAESGFYIE